MTINLEEMKEIAKRLPIGFYLGRKTPVIVEPGKRAYCDTVKGVIHLGVGVLQMAARQIDASDASEWDREALLRCLLYHEIGHLLLTPSDLKQTTLYPLPDELQKHQSDIINIFEDERIESLLASAFIGVNFKKFVRLMHKQGVNGEDMLSKIFKAIRLRETTTEISDEIDDAIKELRKLNVNTTRLVSCWPYNFDNRLVKIINMILEQEKEQNEDSNNSDKSKQSSNNSEQNEPEDSQEEQDGGGQGSTNNSNEIRISLIKTIQPRVRVVTKTAARMKSQMRILILPVMVVAMKTIPKMVPKIILLPTMVATVRMKAKRMVPPPPPPTKAPPMRAKRMRTREKTTPQKARRMSLLPRLKMNPSPSATTIVVAGKRSNCQKIIFAHWRRASSLRRPQMSQRH